MVYLSNIFFLYHDTVTCSMSATRLRIFLLDLIFSPVVGCGGCVDDDWYVWYDLSIYLSVCLSIYLPIYLSIYLSILSCLVLSSLILSYLISLSIYIYVWCYIKCLIMELVARFCWFFFEPPPQNLELGHLRHRPSLGLTAETAPTSPLAGARHTHLCLLCRWSLQGVELEGRWG